MKRLNQFFPVIGGAVAGGLIALAVATGSNSHSATTTVVQQTSPPTSIPTSLAGKGSARGLSAAQIYRKASPGVVDIIVTANTGGDQQLPLFGGSSPSARQEGSGVVYDKKGNIVTDQHVVSGATSVKVNFLDGRSASARVVGTDPSTDVAVIHVDVPASELHPIPFADSSKTQVGDPAVVIGSAFSHPESTSVGIISQVGRTIAAPNNYSITGAIQTDAAVNPGNSGGPLLDGSGDVLGLVDQIPPPQNTTASGEPAGSGVGFAVPSNTAARIADSIISGKPIKHAYVGVELSASNTAGARISSVASGSPAESAGLQPGDVITTLDGKAITSTEQFIETVDTHSPGTQLGLTVKRGSDTKSITLKLGTRPDTIPTG